MRELILAILQKWACKHKWKNHRETATYCDDDERPTKIQQTLICQECGKIKKVFV